LTASSTELAIAISCIFPLKLSLVGPVTALKGRGFSRAVRTRHSSGFSR